MSASQTLLATQRQPARLAQESPTSKEASVSLARLRTASTAEKTPPSFARVVAPVTRSQAPLCARPAPTSAKLAPPLSSAPPAPMASSS